MEILPPNDPKKLTCLIVDDEPLATDLLRSYIQKVEHLQIVGIFHNAIDTFNFLQNYDIDLIFLDIHMPQLNGLDFSQSLSHPPQIIFTTAYREYAVEAFDLEAVDYLVKPIAFERFLKAVSRLSKNVSSHPSSNLDSKPVLPVGRPHLFFKQDREMIKVFLDEIRWIESQKDYVKIHLTSGESENRKEIITYRRISELEQTLPHNLFIRVHKSFIIAIDKITAYDAHSLKIENHSIPIGKIYKQSFKKMMSK